MTEKTQIIDALGEVALLLPGAVNVGLAANDRVKYFFSLLQTACAQAETGSGEPPDLSVERRASGVDELQLNRVVADSRREADGVYLVPGAHRILRSILDGMADMLAPLTLSPELVPDHEVYAERLRALTEELPTLEGDRVRRADLQGMTRADRRHGDSLHLLVMDLHKVLNRLQVAVASESLDGARVYGLGDADRSLITAFMRGLNETSPLKFDHPGLATTATRVGDDLVLQNDIGTTDAHVLVVHVHKLEVTLTYTDIHVKRARFFLSLFEPFAVHWEDVRTRKAAGLEEGDMFYLCVGTFRAAEDNELERYLGFLGSRIVFLIDWNRARKRLRRFVGNPRAVRLLKWAADHNFGHRGFLALGGERLVYDAVDYASRGPLRYGERLDEVLGEEAAAEYLRFVLRATAEGLLAGRSEPLIRDEVRAELLNYFHTAHEGLLGLGSRHATLILEIANGVHEVLSLPPSAAGELAQRVARRAKVWESRADDLLNRTRATVKRHTGTDVYRTLLEQSDDAADLLEEAAFLLTLRTGDLDRGPIRGLLRELAGALVAAGQELVKCFESARHVHRGGERQDLSDFLASIDRIVQLEHVTDEGLRRVVGALVADGGGVATEPLEGRQLYVISGIARALEEAADALARSAWILRDHMLGEVMAT